MTTPDLRTHTGHGESALERWQRLDALMEASRAVSALRESVQALEVIAGMPGAAGDMAKAAIVRVEQALAPGQEHQSEAGR